MFCTNSFILGTYNVYLNSKKVHYTIGEKILNQITEYNLNTLLLKH
jgi:hypothetical protein